MRTTKDITGPDCLNAHVTTLRSCVVATNAKEKVTKKARRQHWKRKQRYFNFLKGDKNIFALQQQKEQQQQQQQQKKHVNLTL